MRIGAGCGGIVNGARKVARRWVAAVTSAVLAAAVLAVGVHLTAPRPASAQTVTIASVPLAADFRHVCMIRAGKAYCWGDNSGGALGTGSVLNNHVGPPSAVAAPPGGVAGVGTPTPVYTGGVLAGKTLRQIAAGTGFACALDTDGHAYCWGSNAYGQLGDNSALSSGVPVAVSGGRTFIQISAGAAHTCAVGSDNRAYCWGSNAYGQLGINSSLPSRSTVPVAVYTGGVLAGKTVTQITGEDTNSTCALASTGPAPAPSSAYCWGLNAYGQLGNDPPECPSGSTLPCPASANRNAPVAVSTPAGNPMAGKNLAQISAGDRHACALDTAGIAYCWGSNGSGRLGCGTGLVTPTTGCPAIASFTGVPVAVYTGQVLSGKVLVKISAGFTHVCVVDTAGAAYCWGANSQGQLGCGPANATTTPACPATGTATSSVPVAVTGASPPTGVLSGKSLTEIATGQYLSCALDTVGAAYCWGYGGFGALGNPSIGYNALAPIAVTAPRSTTIAAGNNHSCMIRTGKAYCWGANDSGQLGQGNTTSTNTPVAVSMPASTTFTQISAGNTFTCALASTGAAYCWGSNSNGQLGDGTAVNATPRTTPVVVSGGRTFTQISAGNAHACAIDTTGAAYCWGSNGSGRLGCVNPGTAPCPATTGNSNVPVAVSTSGMLSGKVLIQVSAGYTHTCALDTGGAVYCWGANGSGQLGNNTTTDSNVPVQVTSTGAGRTLASIAAGNLFTCALDTDGKAYCWGSNSNGQLGGATTGATGARVLGKLGNAVKLSGNSEYVSLPNGIVSGLSNFTISAWVNPSANSPWSRVFDFGTGETVHMFLTLNAGGAPIRFAITNSGGGGEQVINGTAQLPLNTWSHVAVTRYGNTGTLYVNGVAVGTNPSMTLTPANLGVTTQNWIGRSQYAVDPYAAATIDDFQIYNRALSTTEIAALYNSGNGQPGAGNVASYKFDEFSGATALDSSGNGRNATIYGPATASTSSSVPLAVDMSGVLAGKSLAQITLGNSHACSLDTEGKAYCWGANGSGQLGNGNTGTNSNMPVAVTTSGALSDVILTQVSGENNTNCAMGGTGTLSCWGGNGNGQLGNSNTGTDSNVPVPVVSPGTPTNVAAFQDNTKAIVYWTAPTLPPSVTVTGYTATVYFALNTSTYPNAVSCDTTAATTCTIDGLLNPPAPWFPAGSSPFPLINGVSYMVTVVAHTNFATGTNSNGMDSAVSDMATVTPWWPASPAITAGGSHGCTISAGRAYCWGDNTRGQLGDGSTTSTKLPVPVSGLSGKTLIEISAGAQHTCALDTTGAVYCWGDNTDGQLGIGSTGGYNTAPVAVYTGGVMSGVPVAQISAGSRHTCALGSDGAGYCWGYGADGELGNGASGSGASSNVPVTVTHDTGALYGKVLTRITAGDSHTCALDFDGLAYCWGSNSNGQLGTGNTTSSSVPVAVTGLAGRTVTHISAGSQFTCALAATGLMPLPAPPPALAYCWGSNSTGQLGCGTPATGSCPATGSFSTVPMAVSTPAGNAMAGKSLAQISAGDRQACALDTAGAAYCWGSNGSGLLGCGIGTTPTTGCPPITGFSGVPVAVYAGGALPGRFLQQISAGSTLVCVRDTPQGTAYCWGRNTSGQLGNDTTTDATAATPVSPQAPLTPTATTSGTSATISWGLPNPTFVNTGTITGYTVTATPPPGSGLPNLTCSAPAGTYTCTLTGLTPGVRYTVTVTLQATINGVTAPATSAPVTVFLIGYLMLMAPATADLGVGTPGSTVSSSLGPVTVIDDRGTGGGSWTVTAAATNFTSGVVPVYTIPASAATYAPGTVTVTEGTSSITPHNITLSNAPQAVIAATGSGINSATWNPTISVAVPPGAVPGTYTATITHSVT